MIRTAAPVRRWAPRTLRGRLSLVALAVAALLMTVLTVVFNSVVGERLRHQADHELRDRAAAVAATVDTSGPRVRVLESANDRLLDANVWIYAGRRLVEGPSAAPGRGPLTRAVDHLVGRRKAGCSSVTTGGGRPVRLCAQAVAGPRAAATVVAALDLTPYRNSANTLLIGSLVLDGVMLGCTYVLTRLAVGRALRPVRSMTDRAAQWSAVTSDERFRADDGPAELARLGASLDSLLDRTRAVLRHERQLTGELSHELRTPLARIVMELDWWRSRPRTDAETRASQEVIAEAARSMRTICDTLLDDARERALDPAKAPGTTDVAPLLDRLVRDLDAPAAVRVRVAHGASVPVAAVAPAVLERILHPLLSNAARYARSRVTVSARGVPGGVRIDVADDGAGVPDTFVAELFQPGRRADPDDGHDGAGLGLPLARRLARGVGGEVRHERGHAPGALFTVSLPSG